MILGIDEVGRGPWAGPLVVGAVVMGGATIDGLTDSKKLTKKRREELDVLIREQVAGYGLGWVSPSEIDEIGLSDALRLATRRAVEQVTAPYHEIIIDGTINFLANTSKAQFVTTMPKADLLVPSVSAASIIAKVARDAYMAEQHDLYPDYKFKSHVGYGTQAHREAIDAHGVTPLHRLSIAPLAKYAPVRSLADKKPHDITGTNKHTGNVAEDTASYYLQRQGHEVLERNWKTKYCEIDIVSQRGDTIYFTEVKYRKQPGQGGGLAAITPKKYNQMQFAAKFYAHINKITDVNLRLAAMSLTGQPPEVEELIILD